jgi:hypothetical protein
MHVKRTRNCLSVGFALLAFVAGPRAATAGQNQTQPVPSTAAEPGGGQRLGVEGFGTAGITWPAAPDSFDAVGLDSRSFEYGGGARVTGIWRKLFAQVAISRWTDDGERAFVDSEGNSFPLGIPLNVKASYLDVSVGWKDAMRKSTGSIAAWTYVGAGAGVVDYSETSPFAEPGDDVDTRKASYHVFAGVEYPLLGWLAAVVDGRYRFVPDLLGEGGVSSVLEEDILGGFQLTVGVRLGTGGSPRHVPPPRTPPQPPEQVPQPITQPTRILETGGIVEAAPAYLLPDASRTPLRILPQGTSVRILEEAGDWIRLEFNDPDFGPRVGYVQRKYVQYKKQNIP